VKPQLQDGGLDGAGASPHLGEMARREDPKAKPSEREAKLAQALRANLRRRKTAPEPNRAPESPPESGEER
jgi:hypothetical protein